MGYSERRDRKLAELLNEEIENISRIGKDIYKGVPSDLSMNLSIMAEDIKNGHLTTGSRLGDYCLHRRLSLSLPEIIPHQDSKKSDSSRDPIGAAYKAAHILEYLEDKSKLEELSKKLSELEFYLIPFAGVKLEGPQGRYIFPCRENFYNNEISYGSHFTLEGSLIIGRAECLGIGWNPLDYKRFISGELGDLKIRNIRYTTIENKDGEYLIRRSGKKVDGGGLPFYSDLELSGIYWELINIENRMLMGKQNISEALKHKPIVKHIFDLFFSEQYKDTDCQGEYGELYKLGKDGIFRDLNLNGKPLFKVEYGGIKPIEEPPAQLTAA